MIIWIAKDAVFADQDQRAIILNNTADDINVRLLGDYRKFTIRPRHIVVI